MTQPWAKLVLHRHWQRVSAGQTFNSRRLTAAGISGPFRVHRWANSSVDRYGVTSHQSFGHVVGLLFKGISRWSNLHLLLHTAIFTLAIRAALPLQCASLECAL